MNPLARYPTNEMIAWGNACAAWIEADAAYEEARLEEGFYPSEEARIELDAAISAMEAYQAACRDWVTWEILCGYSRWEPDIDLAAEWRARDSMRQAHRHPDQVCYDAFALAARA